MSYLRLGAAYFSAITILLGCAAPETEAVAAGPNELTAEERAQGWILLFDGKSSAGWRGYRRPAMPEQGWRVQEGLLTKVGGERGGDIVTVAQFDDFELSWEWRVGPAGNNGLKYLVTEERPGAPGHEYQMTDDARNRDALRGRKSRTAAFYDVLPPAEGTHALPAGEWNQSRLIIRGARVEHWLNGTQVLEYELGSEALKAAVANSKFKDSRGFGEKIRGHIMLTDHGDECSYRSIKLRPLKP